MPVIKRVRGDNYPLQIQVLKSDGEPENLTGATVFFTVKRNFQDPDSAALIKVETSVHTDPENGLTEFDLSTSNMDIEGTFNYDVKIVLSGQITSVEADKIIFTPHVTIRTS